MTDLDSSDDDLRIERASSEREQKGYSVVLRDTNFKIKFKSVSGKTYSFFEYTLKEGSNLPYETYLKGEYTSCKWHF